MAREVSRAELAKLAGVSASAITKACKHQLRRACIGNRIDLDHEEVQRFLAAHGKSAPRAEPTPPADGRTRRSKTRSGDRQRPAEAKPTEKIDVAALAELPLRELLRRFGTETRFRDWLASLKQIEDIREKRLRNDESVGRLIEREYVRKHVVQHIEAGNRRLLSDLPKTIAARVYAAAGGKAPIEDAERIVRELISSQLTPVAAATARALREEASKAPDREEPEDPIPRSRARTRARPS